MKQKIRVRSPFRGGQIITEPTELYGRDKELEYLETALLHTSNHVEVIAERKFGKTSLLRCFMAAVLYSFIALRWYAISARVPMAQCISHCVVVVTSAGHAGRFE